MKLKRVLYLLETYGIDRILEDNMTTLPEILDLLVDLGYIDLDMYEEEE